MAQDKFDKNYYFGNVYVDYDTFLNWEKLAKDLIKRYKFTSFLDIGCGCGNLVKKIKEQLEGKLKTTCDVQGVDISAFAVDKANVPFVVQANCKCLPFKDKRFDMVYILGTFSYQPKLLDIKQAIKEAYRVSKQIIVFEDVYIVPDKKSDDYDPYREHVLSQKKWMSLWRKIIDKNDIIKTYKDEIIIEKL